MEKLEWNVGNKKSETVAKVVGFLKTEGEDAGKSSVSPLNLLRLSCFRSFLFLARGCFFVFLTSLILLAMILTSGIVGGSSEIGLGLKVQASEAKAWTLIKKENVDSYKRKRMSFYVKSPEAKTFKSRAETVISAAKTLQKQFSVETVIVWLEHEPHFAGQGLHLAKASYAPDGLGNVGDGAQGNDRWVWQVEASDFVTNSKAFEIQKLWDRYRSKFQVRNKWGDMETDEDAIKDFIGKKLNIPSSEVSLPYISRRNYTP